MRPYDYPLHAQARFSQNLLEQGSHPTSERLLAVLRPASNDVANALGVKEGDNVIHLRTLRRANGVPLCLINHFSPTSAGGHSFSNLTAGRCTTS